MSSELSPGQLDDISSSLNIADDVERLFDHVSAQADQIDDLTGQLEAARARITELEDELADAVGQLANLEA